MPDPGLEAAQSTSSEGCGRLNMAYLLLLERRHPSCETDTAVETDSAKIPSTVDTMPLPFRGSSCSGPPKDYIPGVGRGASGFTTRSDVGPAATDGQVGVGSRAAAAAQQTHAYGDAPTGYVAGRGWGMGGLSSGGSGSARIAGEMANDDPLDNLRKHESTGGLTVLSTVINQGHNKRHGKKSYSYL